MQTLNIKMNSAEDARRFLETTKRAERLVRDGYTFHHYVESGIVDVCKPGHAASDYYINLDAHTCSCPDFASRGGYCKHLLAWSYGPTKREEEEFAAAEAAYEAEAWAKAEAEAEERAARRKAIGMDINLDF